MSAEIEKAATVSTFVSMQDWTVSGSSRVIYVDNDGNATGISLNSKLNCAICMCDEGERDRGE